MGCKEGCVEFEAISTIFSFVLDLNPKSRGEELVERALLRTPDRLNMEQSRRSRDRLQEAVRLKGMGKYRWGPQTLGLQPREDNASGGTCCSCGIQPESLLLHAFSAHFLKRCVILA
ncbi:hypothetical protein DNTS_010883 [Danionella cerebrum]|uniref:Uncharacterized protein n=1 Tax=Danionella cerebrum TaxID=2873325 RepID=A0A553PE64_9TELE|nr:hypothetical protein DNTS_010883 [Danionella translucida]